METTSFSDVVTADPFDALTREPSALATVPTERLEAELCTLSAHLDAAACRFVLMVAEYDRRRSWESWEMRSCAHWLAWKCGISLGAAREHVRVGRALEGLPLTRAAMAAGGLSYSKVRAITRVAVPAIEKELLEVARSSTATGLETICRAYRRHGEATEPEAAKRSHAARSFRWHYDDDGSLVFQGRVAPEHAPTIIAMLEAGRAARDEPDPALAEDVPAGTSTEYATDDDVPAGTSAEVAHGEGEDVPAGTHRHRSRRDDDSATLGQGNADAFVLAAEAFLANGPAAVGNGVELTVILDEAVLRGGSGGCHAEHGPALSSHVARRLACDAGVVAAVLGEDGDPLYASKHQYVLNRRLRRALRLRDKHCQFPGCDRKGRLQAHHIVHWVDGGETVLVNLVLLCSKHHHDVHEGGFTLHRHEIEGSIQVRRPDGTLLDATAPAIHLTGAIEDQHRLLGLDIDAATNTCWWEGRTANLSDIICHFDHKLRHANAG
jgi:hypothetical protein